MTYYMTIPPVRTYAVHAITREPRLAGTLEAGVSVRAQGVSVAGDAGALVNQACWIGGNENTAAWDFSGARWHRACCHSSGFGWGGTDTTPTPPRILSPQPPCLAIHVLTAHHILLAGLASLHIEPRCALRACATWKYT
jgi:hypothetical protein